MQLPVIAILGLVILTAKLQAFLHKKKILPFPSKTTQLLVKQIYKIKQVD